MDYKKGVLIAFGELFLKSKGVRKVFQRRLINNLRFFLKKEGLVFKINSFRERIFIKTDQIIKAEKIIKRVFGIAWLAESFYFSGLRELLNFIDKNYQNYIKKDETFAIRIKKDRELIERIAKNINRKVDLNKPKKEIFIESREDGWFLYFKKIRGAGGLPNGSSGRALCLVSGGIDSVPASFLAAKRGAENIWLHFHSFPLVSNSSIEKVKELAKIYLKYQPKLKIYFVSFQKNQLEIKAKAPANYRVLLYRRLMFKIAEKIALKENCQVLITGESLGQVSSQTSANIKIIEEKIKMPVLRPLISWDKEEIIDLAQKIGTYNISIKPQEDCCTLFVSKHQTAQGSLEIVKKLEKKLKPFRLDYDLYLI
jgi:thiamine biosynthesis protein ThiI